MLKSLPLGSGTRQGHLLPKAYSTLCGDPRQCNKARKGNMRHADWKGRRETVFFADHMIVDVKNSKNFTKKLPEEISKLSVVTGAKVNTKSHSLCLKYGDKPLEIKIKVATAGATKYETLRDIFDKIIVPQKL